jgi:hypothetical protein
MTAFKANPFAYIFPAILIFAVVIYFIYGALNRLGLPTQTVAATVTNKTYTPGTTTYNNNVVAGRTYVQSYQQPDTYALSLEINGQNTVGLVTKDQYDAINIGDQVTATIAYTRFSKQMMVEGVNK